MPRRVAIVPHTHWDREWYAPFQAYRLRLVELLDDFLPLLEGDPSYRHFLLDGQTAVVDDYLEVRPGAEERIRRMVSSGRLSVGPWMILMDEFMVSAETIVRNLQAGLRRAAQLGGAMEVGYLPDMFGHVAQMPQILSQAGFSHAVVWRGVPAAIRSTGFWWEAPDGSRVRAEYLYGSYSNGRDIPREPELLVERARSYEAELGEARLDGLLLMNGTDHQVPQPWLGDVVDAANRAQDDFRFEVTSLAEHVADQPVEGLPTWRGELRSGARANVLMGVASNRVDVHQAAAVAERSLERRAEPLGALVWPAGDYPGALLDLAWRLLILNSAHDSSCACSHDEVVDQVLVRYREARQIADGVTHDAVRTLAAQVGAPAGSAVVVNPTARPRGGLVEIPVPGDGPLHFEGPEGPVPAQVVHEETGERFATQVVGSKLGWVLDMLRGEEFAGAPVAGYSVEPRPQAAEGTFDVVVETAGPGDTRVDVEPLRERLLELATVSGPGTGVTPGEAVFHIRALRARTRQVLVAVQDVPGFGWSTFEPRSGALDGPAPVSVDPDSLTARNEHVRVSVDATQGTFTLTLLDQTGEPASSVSGLGRLVDGGDGGDTYNYSPPEVDLLIEGCESCDVGVVESGPVRVRIVTTTRHRWPRRAEGDERSCSSRSPDFADVTVRTTLELRAGEPLVRVCHELDNPCRDHRVRVHLPLPAGVEHSDAECAFGVVRRDLAPEGGPNEAPLATYPSRRFVDCSDGEVGLGVVHDGLLEHEVVDGAELAITLLRSVGYLSRVEPALRPNPAGPPVPVEGAQVLGRRQLDYAVVLHQGRWSDADFYRLADQVLVPLERAPAGGPRGSRPRSGSMLQVEGGAEISSLHRDPNGSLVLRVFNPAAEPVRTLVSDSDGKAVRGWTVDLRGRPLERFDGTLVVEPARFATVMVTGR